MCFGSNENHPFRNYDFRFRRLRNAVGLLSVHADRGKSNLRAHRFQTAEHVIERFGFAGVLLQPDNGNAAVG